MTHKAPERMLIVVTLAATVLSVAALHRPALALDDAHHAKARAAVDKAVAFLRDAQNEDGSWTPRVGPAVTALVAAGMLRDPDISRDDPAVAKAIAFVVAQQKQDGAIYDRILPNYNTAISLMALGQVADQPGMRSIINKAQQYLVTAQWKPGMTDPQGNPITAEHPYYGGAGYGNHGRPDMSNTTMMLEGLYDSGFDCTDPAFKRALVFLQSCQGVESNERFDDRIVQNGGFIYSNSVNKDNIGTVESRANPQQIDRVRDGKSMTVDKVRPYGAMSYAGFKSYIYAQLQRDDPRVLAVRDWIANHYDLSHNVGMPSEVKMQGYYYYLYVFGRAMGAWGEPTITTADGRTHDWANDLVDTLVSRQRPDGSWLNEADRYMEGDPNLVTAYCLNALQMALASR